MLRRKNRKMNQKMEYERLQVNSFFIHKARGSSKSPPSSKILGYPMIGVKQQNRIQRIVESDIPEGCGSTTSRERFPTFRLTRPRYCL